MGATGNDASSQSRRGHGPLLQKATMPLVGAPHGRDGEPNTVAIPSRAWPAPTKSRDAPCRSAPWARPGTKHRRNPVAGMARSYKKPRCPFVGAPHGRDREPNTVATLSRAWPAPTKSRDAPCRSAHGRDRDPNTVATPSRAWPAPTDAGCRSTSRAGMARSYRRGLRGTAGARRRALSAPPASPPGRPACRNAGPVRSRRAARSLRPG
jgi:hypothetical protein